MLEVGNLETANLVFAIGNSLTPHFGGATFLRRYRDAIVCQRSGVVVLGMSIWYDANWLPLDPPVPLRSALRLYGLFFSTCEIAIEDAN
jgi:hypothetical protein